MTDTTLLTALAQALKSDPRNGPLWLHYASLLAAAARSDEAIAALRTAVEIAGVREAALRELVPLLCASGQLAEALIRAEAWLESHPGDAAMRAELERIHAARGSQSQASGPPVRAAARTRRPGEEKGDGELNVLSNAPVQGDEVEWASQFDWGDLRITLGDVAGLEDIKRQIRLRILAPFKNPSVYEAFGRSGGGGLLLYGPPGCGKTYVARATAGELGARFVSVSIHEVLDKFFGESEKLDPELPKEKLAFWPVRSSKSLPSSSNAKERSAAAATCTVAAPAGGGALQPELNAVDSNITGSRKRPSPSGGIRASIARALRLICAPRMARIAGSI